MVETVHAILPYLVPKSVATDLATRIFGLRQGAHPCPGLPSPVHVAESQTLAARRTLRGAAPASQEIER